MTMLYSIKLIISFVYTRIQSHNHTPSGQQIYLPHMSRNLNKSVMLFRNYKEWSSVLLSQWGYTEYKIILH